MQVDITKKILIAYFSHSGNTREIADQIHKGMGGDIFEIQSVKPYPHDYDAVVQQARQELDSGYKPALKTKFENIRPYDLVFIGYPNWWGTVPAPVRTFLMEYDFSGKPLYRSAHTREAVWDEALQTSQNFVRNRPCWMVLPFGEGT